MKNGNIISFTLDSFIRKKRKSLCEIFLLTVCLFLLIISIFINKQEKYFRTSLDDVLANKIEGTGILSFEFPLANNEKGDAFLNEAINSPIIDSIGTMEIGGHIIFPELADIQKGHTLNETSTYNEVEIYYIKPTLLPLCNITLSEGTIETNTSEKGIYWSGIYLGSAYKNIIPVGTIYTQYIESLDVTCEYEVMGILENNSRWLTSNVCGFISSGLTNGYDNMDYSIIMTCNDGITTSSGFFSYNEKYTYEDAKKYIKELSDKYDISLFIGNLDQSIKQVENESQIYKDIYKKLFYLLSITSIICLLSFQMISILSNSYEYGVYYSLGANQKNIIFMIVSEMILKILISFLFALSIGYYFIQKEFIDNNLSSIIATQILLKYVIIKVFLGGLLIGLIALIIPFFFLKNMKPIELMRLNNI